MRNVVELETDAGIIGIGETHGGETVTTALEKCRAVIVGQSAFAYRKFGADLMKLGNAAYAGIELACLDAVGKATGRRLCELLGGPAREKVEFGSYLFYRYAADHPKVLDDAGWWTGAGTKPWINGAKCARPKRGPRWRGNFIRNGAPAFTSSKAAC